MSGASDSSSSEQQQEQDRGGLLAGGEVLERLPRRGLPGGSRIESNRGRRGQVEFLDAHQHLGLSLGEALALGCRDAERLVQRLRCQKCGYALSRASTRTSARKIQYYRCIGTDGWRHLGGPRCDTRPVRQDLLDEVVWTEVIRLLEEPALIQQELDRRLAAAQAADPTRIRTQAVERDLARVGKTMERLLTAYQEELVSTPVGCPSARDAPGSSGGGRRAHRPLPRPFPATT